MRDDAPSLPADAMMPTGCEPPCPRCSDQTAERLLAAGLRPTRQRLALAKLLFEDGDHRHVTAEQLHGEAVGANIPVSLATIYNTLNQFRDAGLLRELVVEPGSTYFDTNIDDHHHFFHEEQRRLQDVSCEALRLAALPELPPGTKLKRVDVIIRLSTEG